MKKQSNCKNNCNIRPLLYNEIFNIIIEKNIIDIDIHKRISNAVGIVFSHLLEDFFEDDGIMN